MIIYFENCGSYNILVWIVKHLLKAIQSNWIYYLLVLNHPLKFVKISFCILLDYKDIY